MGWIGVDLDGVLAEYHGRTADGSIGAPVPRMVERVKAWLVEGKDVRIFTARVWPLETVWATHDLYREQALEAQRQFKRIQRWCQEHIGRALSVTCVKDYAMLELWDDRCRQVVPNTGRAIDEATEPE